MAGLESVQRERRRGSKDHKRKREAIVSGTHTGVGLDSFITRAPHGARGREEGNGTGERRGEGGKKKELETHTYIYTHIYTYIHTRGRKRKPCVAQFGTNGKNETHCESVRNQFAMHYAIRGTRLPRQTGI